MGAKFVFLHRINDDEIDGYGHVNNKAYVGWMQEAAIAHSTAVGWDPSRYRSNGIGWLARSHTITYLQPAFVAEDVEVQTWVVDMKKVTSLRRYEIVRRTDAVTLATAETQWVFVNLQSFKPLRIPTGIRESFSPID